MVYREDAPWLRIELNLEQDEFHVFQESVAWEGAHWLGFGCRVARVSLDSLEVKEWRLDGYFGSFFPLPDSLLVSSATELCRFNKRGDKLWTCPNLGIDGVLVNEVRGDVVHGEGEWDPPSGWEPFRVDLNEGRVLGL